MVDLLDNFLNPLKLFFGCDKQFPEIAMREICGGSGENDEQRTSYSQSGERWGERAETKASRNGECCRRYFVTQSLLLA
jgi:hypothetical protein